ncbi:MAG: family transcriptional regulator [Hydrocarboniphaga sp.]|uniref:helix-turn-helix domain-containing protein n=1 Tax=Hydrocarboniphaga sp. TaxID=2033016 RepID=UPI0026204C34|nr:helix-turn-helix transcriptional regulator [Hydrocarboniphaga sp.]MDB5971948.1 family transcriptional regulator [Hydrocarboniphaga sp.]
MSKVQYIEEGGRRKFAVVPIKLWERLAQDAEMQDEVRAYDAAKANDSGVRIPAEVMRRELQTGSALLAWREYRDLTQNQLAAQAGISKPYLSQIETGKRKGAAATLKKLAAVLQVPMDVLAD